MSALIFAKVPIYFLAIRCPISQRRKDALQGHVRKMVVSYLSWRHAHLEQLNHRKDRWAGLSNARSPSVPSRSSSDQRTDVYRACHAASVTNPRTALAALRGIAPLAQELLAIDHVLRTDRLPDSHEPPSLLAQRYGGLC